MTRIIYIYNCTSIWLQNYICPSRKWPKKWWTTDLHGNGKSAVGIVQLREHRWLVGHMVFGPPAWDPLDPQKNPSLSASMPCGGLHVLPAGSKPDWRHSQFVRLIATGCCLNSRSTHVLGGWYSNIAFWVSTCTIWLDDLLVVLTCPPFSFSNI